MTTAREDTPKGDLILYETEDGRTRIEGRFEGETVWLTQAVMAQLFDIGVGTVNHHLSIRPGIRILTRPRRRPSVLLAVRALPRPAGGDDGEAERPL